MRVLGVVGAVLVIVIGTIVTACGDDEGGETLAPGEYGLLVSANVTVEELEPGAARRPSAQGARAGTLEGSGRLTLVEGGEFTLGDLRFDVKVEGDDAAVLNLAQDPERESTGQTGPDGTTMDLLLVASDPQSDETFTLDQPIRLESDERLRAGREMTFRGQGWTASSESTERAITFDPVREEWSVEITGTEALPTPTVQVVLDEPLASFADAIGVRPKDFGSFRVDADPLTGDVTIYTVEGTPAGLRLLHLDLRRSFAARLHVPAEAAASIEAAFPCDGSLVVCASDSFPRGDVLLAGGVVAGSIPLEDEEQGYLYAAALQDEDGSNDWSREEFNWDFYQGTDLIVERGWSVGGWQLLVSTVVEEGLQETDVNAWSIIFPAEGEQSHTLYSFFISEEDLQERYEDRTFRSYRMTTYGSDLLLSAEPEASGGDVMGVDPTEPPLPLPEGRITLAPPPAATPEAEE